jgi:hypothetical protein
VKWAEKEERFPWRKNLRRDEYSGTGVKENASEQRSRSFRDLGARHRLILRTLVRGSPYLAHGIEPKGFISLEIHQGNNARVLAARGLA